MIRGVRDREAARTASADGVGRGVARRRAFAHRLPPRTRPIASARVAESRSWPRTAEVMVREPGRRTPRMDMHRCSHSITTMTPRGQVGRHGVGDLGGQPLLHLGAPGVDVDQPGQLGQAGHPPVLTGDVAQVRDTVERHQVVLAGAVDLDVAHQDELGVPDLERGGRARRRASAACRRRSRRRTGPRGPASPSARRAQGPRPAPAAARGRRARPRCR